MKELELKYGCNPNQKPARIYMEDGSELPVRVLCGRPGYINFLDAFNAWQLVRELKAALGLPAVTSFKHVSPTSAAVGIPLPEKLKRACFVEDVPELDSSPLACAYARARGTDRMCSFGDWVALSDVCDGDTARFLAAEVSDGVIAPGYTDEALDILKAKRKGGYNVVEIDPNYEPAPIERRNIFGITFEQGYNSLDISEEMLQNIVTENKDLPQQAKHDMLLSLITLKYTQSNSVCYVQDGQTIGVGAGQHDRILHGGLGVLRLAQIGVGLLVVLNARNQQEPDKKHNERQHQNDVQQNFIALCHWCNFHSALLYCCGAASTQRRSME